MNFYRYSLIIVSSLLLSGRMVSQTPDQLKSWLPVLTDWVLQDEVEVFNPDNLFDRINGSAPLFIENNFREMTSMEYKRGEDYITIQAYRHATPEDAFGMYASERSPDLSFVPVGGEGQGDGKSLFFFAGNVYAKIWTNSSVDIGDELVRVGQSLAEQIDSKAAYPYILTCFPSNDKIPYSEAYITSNYIGHDFLRGVYVTKYQKGNEVVQLFVIKASSKEDAKQVLERYFAFTKQAPDFTEGELVVNDRYNGDIPMIWKGAFLIGVFSESGNSVPDAGELIRMVAEKL